MTSPGTVAEWGSDTHTAVEGLLGCRELADSLQTEPAAHPTGQAVVFAGMEGSGTSVACQRVRGARKWRSQHPRRGPPLRSVHTMSVPPSLPDFVRSGLVGRATCRGKVWMC